MRLESDYASLFERITSDARYRQNLDWGRRRAGHPEGTIRAHILELEKNLDRLKPGLSDSDVWKLRLLIHVHDSFKPNASPQVAIQDPRSHASLAREFFSEFTSDGDLLAVVQWHDEPYALWRNKESKGAVNQARLDALLEAIQDWNLFLRFLIVDGCTVGKTRAPLKWFFGEVRDRIQSEVREQDILT